MRKIFLIVLFGILISFASAINVNQTIDFDKATMCLNDSRSIMAGMQEDGFNVQRVNDSINTAENLYISQLALQTQKKNYDFSIINDYCIDIEKIQEDAYASRDDFLALTKFYNESIVQGMNTSEIDSLMLEIKTEIDNERYEKISPLVDKAYQDIVKLKSSYTTLNLFYETTTRGIQKFVLKYKYALISILFIGILFFLVFRKRIIVSLVKRKIGSLNLRKNTLKGLVMAAQRDYFNKGTISQEEYNIKINKFGELIRDIDRQIPLLREELAKLEVRKKNAKN